MRDPGAQIQTVWQLWPRAVHVFFVGLTLGGGQRPLSDSKISAYREGGSVIEGLSTRVADEGPSGIDSIDQWAKRLSRVPPFGAKSSTSPHSDARSNESNCIDLEGFSPKTASAIANVHNGKTKSSRYSTFSNSSKTPANGTGYNSYDSLPFIATPELGHLSALDVRFMQLNGCFDLPPMPILNELVRMYFLHTHPIVPLLDEGDFWDSFSCSNGEKIPLLLFQAMVFAACAVSPASKYPSYDGNTVVSLTTHPTVHP